MSTIAPKCSRCGKIYFLANVADGKNMRHIFSFKTKFRKRISIKDCLISLVVFCRSLPMLGPIGVLPTIASAVFVIANKCNTVRVFTLNQLSFFIARLFPASIAEVVIVGYGCTASLAGKAANMATLDIATIFKFLVTSFTDMYAHCLKCGDPRRLAALVSKQRPSNHWGSQKKNPPVGFAASTVGV